MHPLAERAIPRTGAPTAVRSKGSSSLLSLARRPGQKIRIGEDIVVVVREVRGRQVKLGIEAPADVRVLREEIFEELSQSNRDAASSLVPEALEALQKAQKP